IRAGQFSSIYLFYGREEYLMENYIKGIENKLLAQEERDFNFNEYDLKETTIQEVIANAETFPFMCDKRIVLARNALFLTSSRVSSSVEHDLDAFIRYIHNP
ncbi:MAG TPA: DNA polymerase III subunit delta, partial [Paenibacillaceae bacterium]|nr:DNA polymerase III subunit delta [Paenibacillaceae bacterium]